MKITKITVEFDLSGDDSNVQQLRDFLDAYIVHTSGMDEEPVGEVQTVETEDGQVDPEHLRMLRLLEAGLSSKQKEVWEYFKAHPGPVSAAELKKEFDFLRPQGALPGVFRATMRWMGLGGERETSPFVQVRWLGGDGGEYRGLTAAEVKALNNP